MSWMSWITDKVMIGIIDKVTVWIKSKQHLLNLSDINIIGIKQKKMATLVNPGKPRPSGSGNFSIHDGKTRSSPGLLIVSKYKSE